MSDSLALLTDPQVVQMTQAACGSDTVGFRMMRRNSAKSFALSIVESEDYRQSIRSRAKTGNLPPAIEQMLWYYAYGKPVETVAVTVSRAEEDLAALSPQQLRERADAIAAELAEAQHLAEVLEAEFAEMGLVEKSA